MPKILLVTARQVGPNQMDVFPKYGIKQLKHGYVVVLIWTQPVVQNVKQLMDTRNVTEMVAVFYPARW
jgi:hypothetical protein